MGMSMKEENLSRKDYLTKNSGNYPETIELFGQNYEKVDDLRYGTNPHQTACFYRPANTATTLGNLKVLKSGKSGLSQTNLEDISYTLNICKFFDQPCCACMKHVNPCGVAVSSSGKSLQTIYAKARNCDPRAAFGSVVGFNCEVDQDTAKEIMSSFVECVVAPTISDEALEVFNDSSTFKLNRHIRVLQCGDLGGLPKFIGDDTRFHKTMKVLADGTIVVADPLLTHLKSTEELQAASGSSKATGEVRSTIPATPDQLRDLLTAWYININVRSNGVVLVKNGVTLAVGTGEQDRVGAVEQAIWKFNNKFEGEESIKGSVMASDGFFPFADAVETAAEAGVKAIISPSGSLKDADVIRRANELQVALYHAPERIFSHH